MENQLINAYLAKKGFTEDDLYKAQAVFLDNGNLKTNQQYPWLKQVVATEPLEDGTEIHKTTLDVINGKAFRYHNEGCDAAIFVPLFKLNGEFTGLSIRKMCDSSKQDSWFVPGTRKIDLLYNLVNAFDTAVMKNSIIITEGVYDTLALVKHGFANSVALLGTHISNIQFFQLMSMVENVALCLDNDTAGTDAMNKIVSTYKNAVTFWKVDIDKDPDEFLAQHGALEFRKRIHKWQTN